MISVKTPFLLIFHYFCKNFPVREHFVILNSPAYCFSRSGILYLGYGNS